MTIKEIMITRGRKYTKDYQSINYNVGLTFEIDEDNKDFDLVRQEIVKALQKIVVDEEIRCRDTMLLQDYENSKGKEPKTEPQFKKETIVVEEKTTISEEVLMTPDGVTIIMKTPKSLLVTKKGYQKWIAFSLMSDITEDSYEIGEYIEVLNIKEDKKKWFNEVKGWDKLEVRKS